MTHLDSASRPSHTKPRGGSVLFVVLVVIVMITLSAYTFTELMYIENKATHLTGRQVQARNVAESGVAMFQQQRDDVLGMVRAKVFPAAPHYPAVDGDHEAVLRSQLNCLVHQPGPKCAPLRVGQPAGRRP